MPYILLALTYMLWLSVKKRTRRQAGALIRALNLIGKTRIFSEASRLYGVAPDESTDWKATDGKLHETQVEKL